MLNTRFGIAFSYIVSGTTASAGGANIAARHVSAEQIQHLFFGFPISEVALMVGILGTIATVVFQYLNYRNIKRQRQALPVQRIKDAVSGREKDANSKE